MSEAWLDLTPTLSRESNESTGKSPSGVEWSHLTSQGQAQRNLSIRRHSGYVDASPHSYPTSQHIGSPVFNDSALQIDMYCSITARCLCACDPDFNPFRTGPLLRHKTSILSRSICNYIVMAYNMTSSTDGCQNPLYRQTQSQVEFHINQEIKSGMHTLKDRRLELVLCIIMYGLSKSWDGSTDLGLHHYNTAVSMFHLFQDETPNARKFFWQTLVYWWCALSCVSDAKIDGLSDPPELTENDPYIRRSSDGRYVPHPLTGASAEVFLLMGQVCTLAYSSRLEALASPVITLAYIERQSISLKKASLLESKLQSFKLPSVDDFVLDSNAHTSIRDLIRMSQVYRIAALLTLYKCFPDLLHQRLVSNRCEGEDLTSDEQLKAASQLWRKSAAQYVLYLLSQNDHDSGTTSTEQIILVVISGELYESTNTMGQASSLYESVFEMDSSPATTFNTPSISDPEPVLEHLEDTNMDDLFSNTVHVCDKESSVSTLKSPRKHLLKRLANIRCRLPYPSVNIVEMVIHEIWARLDMGLDTFWIDIIIGQGWRSVMA